MSRLESRRSRRSSCAGAASCRCCLRPSRSLRPSRGPDARLRAAAIRGGAFIILTSALAGSSPAQGARHETRFEIGVAQIDQPGTHERSALVVGGVRSHADSTLAGLLAANATFAHDSVAAVQFIGALAWRPSPLSQWQVEGGASGAVFSTSKIGSDGNGSAWLRLRRQFDAHVGAVTGASVGQTARGSNGAHATSVELGGWFTSGPFTVDLTAARTRTEDSLLMAASRVFTRERSGWLDMQDIVASVAWAHGPIDVSATQRWRMGVLGTSTTQSALSGSATYAFTPIVSLVVTGGRQLADPLRGAPDATVLSAVVRFTFAELGDETPPQRESDASVARMTDGTVLIVRIRAPAAARVEVAGSFSGWEPVPVEHKGAYWEAQVRVPPGQHRVAYRVDGGAWRAPNGLARIREFGGEVGLIVIP